MNCKFTGKIAKDGKYLTYSDDIRLSYYSKGWRVGGFAHNPDGQDIKSGTMVQGADHYGHKAGEEIGITIIDKPEFFGLAEWNTLDAARHAINEGVPLKSKWGLPAEHFGQHVPITFAFLSRESYGECILYDLKIVEFGW